MAHAPPTIELRRGTPADAEACGRICFEAFRGIATRHGFPPDFPSPDASTGMLAMLLAHPRFYAVVAERRDRVVGSNFLDERGAIAGVGPITVDPAVQDAGTGRLLMEDVLARAARGRFAGVRLLQASYHGRSLALYARLGFQVREPIACLQGTPPGVDIPGREVRAATKADLQTCNALCRRVHGFDRGGELADAIAQRTAAVVVDGRRVTGYATAPAFFGHAVGETADDVKALLAAADAFGGPGILVPARDAELLRWCLDHGLRVVHVMTLMSLGDYTEPAGCYLPSVLY